MITLHATVGATALVIILAISLIGIYHPRINDGLVGRVLYMAIALLCVGGLAHIAQGTIPRSLVSWLLLMMAGIMAREILRERYGAIVRSRWALCVKTMRAKNAKHQR